MEWGWLIGIASSYALRTVSTGHGVSKGELQSTRTKFQLRMRFRGCASPRSDLGRRNARPVSLNKSLRLCVWVGHAPAEAHIRQNSSGCLVRTL